MKKMKSEVKLIPIIFVVYQSKKALWKGFCAPYDVTCFAKTADEAKDRLEKLVSLYEGGLKKYNWPKHLVSKNLSDKEDQKILKELWPKILAKISEDIQRYKTYHQYIERKATQRKEFKVTNDDLKSFVEYTEKPLAIA